MTIKDIKEDLKVIKDRLKRNRLTDNQDDKKLISAEDDYTVSFPLGSPERDMLQDKMGIDFPILEEQQWLEDKLKATN